jgi:hypothetical protein
VAVSIISVSYTVNGARIHETGFTQNAADGSGSNFSDCIRKRHGKRWKSQCGIDLPSG